MELLKLIKSEETFNITVKKLVFIITIAIFLTFNLHSSSDQFFINKTLNVPEITNVNNFSFITTSTWYEYTLNTNLSVFKNEKLALIELLTFRNKKPFQLKQIRLQWQGVQMKNIYASLYTKKEHEVLSPIEQNLVCDGRWNHESQEMIFSLDEKILSVSKLYLVLQFPENIESDVKKGRFLFDQNNSLKFVRLD